jgi:hypothetical protein
VIKVQPRGSRVVRSETPDLLTLTLPPKGFVGRGGLLMLLAVVWGIGVVVVTPREWWLAGAVAAVPSIVAFGAGLADSRKTWTLKRSAEEVSFNRRKWPATDVTSFWVEEVEVPREPTRYVLRVGFRNGRSEDVLSDASGDDVRWIAALMKDPKGERRPVPGTARAAAEPSPRRMDPSVVPVSLRPQRSPDGGAELTFLPLIGFKRRRWKLLGIVIAGLAAILALGALGGPWISRVGVSILLLWTIFRVLTLSRSAVVRIDKDTVTITQNQHREGHQVPVPDIRFVQTFRDGGEAELQFLIEGKPKLRLFHGRPGDELEWAARFLRVALKHRPEEEAAPMKVDAAAGECQVCNESMETRVVYCGKCRTPHHEECWSYLGQCSTYGCREIRFTRA